MLAVPAVTVAQGPAASRPPAKAPVEQGIRWNDLKPGQKSALLPLERQWSEIDVVQKRKWLELSARFPRMTPTERARVQERMTEWAKLTPDERGEARLRYQDAKELTPTDRQARWDAYQALTPEEKRQFAARAATPPPGPSEPDRAGSANRARTDHAPHPSVQSKSNIVPNSSFAAPPRAVTPTLVQAGPGATTTPITKRATPPSHEQPGVPKIAATPEFVNGATLLPRRGPQAAATQPMAVPAVQPAASR
jgi:hypothetical protein